MMECPRCMTGVGIGGNVEAERVEASYGKPGYVVMKCSICKAVWTEDEYAQELAVYHEKKAKKFEYLDERLRIHAQKGGIYCETAKTLQSKMLRENDLERLADRAIHDGNMDLLILIRSECKRRKDYIAEVETEIGPCP